MTFDDLTARIIEILDAPWKVSLAILVGSVIAAAIVDLVFTRIIRRLTARTRTDVDDRIITGLHKPIFLSVVLAGLYLAIERLEIHSLYEVVLGRLLATIAVIVWTVVAVRIAKLVLEVLSRHEDRFRLIDRGTLGLFDNIANVVLFGGAIYLVLHAWQIDVTGWIASAGIVGL
ncbi:MAG: hypothetical protein R3190_12730, partial [Thermoanaerobaculia bacterium]|nr:hypothetical protein [Thermoanaerobaculia bacterium]